MRFTRRGKIAALAAAAVLQKMPCSSTKQMQALLDIPAYETARRLERMEENGLAVRCSLRGAERMQQRWSLSRAGVKWAEQETGVRPRWQVGQAGIASLAERMPVVDYIYDFGLAIGGHEVQVNTRSSMGYQRFIQTVRSIAGRGAPALDDVVWCEGGDVDAALAFANGFWMCVCWVGTAQTRHDLQGRLQRVHRVPGATLDPETGEQLTPNGWVFLCHDALGAAQVGELWPGDDALIMTVAGHVERRLRLSVTDSPAPRGIALEDLGTPELATRWSKSTAPLWTLEHELVYPVFRFIGEHRGAIRRQVKREFGTRAAGAIAELTKRGREFAVERDGAVYLSEKGGKAWAALDGADVGKVLARVGAVLGHHVSHRRAQRPHDQAQIDVRHQLQSEGIPCFGGYRRRLFLRDGKQIVPDLVACVPLGDGATLPVNIEIEFSATSPQASQSRPDAYDDAKWEWPKGIPCWWVLPDESVRRRYQSALEDLVAFTTTLPELLAGTSRGDDSVWRDREGDRVPLTEIADIMERELPEDEPTMEGEEETCAEGEE